AVKFFSFCLDVASRPNLPRSHNLVVVNKKHGSSTGSQQLLNLREFALFYLRGESIVASLPNSMCLVGYHDINYIHIRAHVTVEIAHLCGCTGPNYFSDGRGERTGASHIMCI